MSLPIKDRDYHTYADYLTWPEGLRYELIDGCAYLMAPAPDLVHRDIAGEIYRQAANALQGKPCKAFIAPVDVRLPKATETDEAVDTVLQPDVLVVCDETKLDRRGVRGAPEWVVEVISPATASHDQIIKRRLYERSGVKEYWLVHPTDRLLTVYRLVNGEYGKSEMQELRGETRVGAVPDLLIIWDALVARLPQPE